ncbi:MAG: bifunctional nuclease family protein [Pyrinomonadaceae bacterium]|nr:bifunctional nuclease family protein [Pyrinomonadaceae bacterium]
MELEVKIRGLMMDPNSGTPIIILKDINSDAMLPIWVGAYEANAIALEIEKIAPQRPMTHDLLRNFIVEMGAHVERVVVTDLRDNTFFAVIELQNNDGDVILLDARPSDAIALALRVDSPIFVNEDVLVTSRGMTESAQESSGKADAVSEEEWPDIIGEAGDLPM